MKIKQLLKKPALIGLVLWYTITWSWSLQTDTLNLAGSTKQGFIMAVIVMIINVALSVYIMHWFFRFADRIKGKLPAGYFVAVLLLVFAFADFLVAWIPAALWAGPQGRMDSILPLSSGALALIHTPLIFASRFIGFYGLAAFVWTIAYLMSQKQYRRYVLYPAVIITVISLVGWTAYRAHDGKKIDATLVSEAIVDRVPAITPAGQDVIIFPEYGLEKVDGSNLRTRIAKPEESPKTYFIGSEQIYKTDRTGHENRMLFGNSKDGITLQQDKYRLIPGGEDLPYIVRTMLRATGQRDTLDYFSYAKGVITGEQQLKIVPIDNDIQLGAALCSSIIAPQDYRDFARQGADILTNSASLSTFKGSRIFAWEQQSFAKFMAVSNSRYFLQSANSASAYAIDNNGHKYAEVFGKNTIEVQAFANSRKTFYTYFGEWMAWFGGLVVIAVIIIWWRLNRKIAEQVPKPTRAKKPKTSAKKS